MGCGASAFAQDDLHKGSANAPVQPLSAPSNGEVATVGDGVPTTSPELVGIDALGTLLGARPEHFEHGHADMLQGAEAPRYESVSALLASQPDNEELARQTQNIVKKCENCGKANAKTLAECNNCGQTLPAELTTSLNVCIAFIYGVAPLKISIRHQSEDVLVYDDLMQCTTCHFNSISTKNYIQDWRCLLRRPQEALSLIDRLHEAADEALRSQFWSNSKWKDTFLHVDARSFDFERLRSLVCAGFNFPPSQYQLHLQYLLPPFVPHQFQMLNEGKSFVYGRFFPVEYVRDVLRKALAGQNVPGIDAEVDIETIVAHFDALGVVYKDIHNSFVQKVKESHRILSNWQPSHFRYRLTTAGVVDPRTGQSVDVDYRDVLREDLLVLQNYGRPFLDEKPCGSFYSHPSDKVLETW